jgi:hypothetical protein
MSRDEINMPGEGCYYLGNAGVDQVRGSGWFIGQFVPPELGLRHQTDVEVKWGVHPDGDRRAKPWATGNARTIAILVRGKLRLWFRVGNATEQVTLLREGDYVVFGPHVVHSWEAVGDTLVLSVRFPSVASDRTASRERAAQS